MRDDQHKFLSLIGQLPLRLTVEQLSTLLNCGMHDVPVLVAARLLKPLGNPPQNGTKYFCTSEILELSKNRVWLAKMSNAITLHWQKKNEGKRKKVVETQPLEVAAV